MNHEVARYFQRKVLPPMKAKVMVMLREFMGAGDMEKVRNIQGRILAHETLMRDWDEEVTKALESADEDGDGE